MKVTGNIFECTTTQTNMARALGLTPARVNQLIQEGIIVRDEKDQSGGVYVVRSIKNWYESKKSLGAEGDYWLEHGLHERAKRQLAELKLAKEEGRVYEASVVERVMIEQLVGLRTHLLGLALKMAPVLEGCGRGEIYERLSEEIEMKLSELSTYDPKLFLERE